MRIEKINKVIILFFLITISVLHFLQLYSQHWSAILDQDLIIIYNSLLFTSGLEQEYRDHPAFTTFLLHSFFYNIIGFILDIPTDINQILNSDEIELLLQKYFFISRSVNFFINIILIYIFSKVLKRISITREVRYLILLIFIISSGYITSFFLLRSEVLSLALFLTSLYFILSKNRNYILSSFIAGIFFALAMLSKIQIIFLLPFLLIIIAINNYKKLSKNDYLNNYLIISILIGMIGYLFLQLYLQNFPRFEKNYLIDLIFFVCLFFIFFSIYWFSKEFKKKIVFLSSFLNGFIVLIILLIFLDGLELVNINQFIFLRLTNPIHYMTEFTGTFANEKVNLIYLVNIFKTLFSSYKFDLFELIFITLLSFIAFRNNKYILLFFLLFIFNTLVVNYRYLPIYHIYYIFSYLMLLSFCFKNFNIKIQFYLSLIVFLIVCINSLNFFIFNKDNMFNIKNIFERDAGMKKVCKEIKNISKSNTYENVDYIYYWHSKIDKKKLIKICNANIKFYLN